MSEKLKIYACSGIGEATPKVKFNTNGNTVSNTQAVNMLLVKMNSKLIEAKRLRGLSKEQKIEALNDADFFYVAAELAKKYQKDSAELLRAGYVMATLSIGNIFECDTLDETKREEHLKAAMQEALWAMDDDNGYYDDPEWMQWWQLNVIDRNKTGLNFGQQQIVRKVLREELAAMQKNINDFSDAVKGIGEVDTAWMENEELSEYLQNGGKYFLYTYLTDAQISKLPSVFKQKRTIQNRLYNYCKGLFVEIYGSEEEMREIIRSSIIDYYQEEPEALAELIVSGDFKENEKVGELVTLAATMTIGELIQIIALCASVLITIIYMICQCVYKSNTAKYAAIDKALVEDGVPDGTDYSELKAQTGSSILGGKTDWITIALIGVGAFLLLRK